MREELRGITYTVLKDPRRRSVDHSALKLQDAYFVMADNRNHGTGSRTFGPVPDANILGVVTHRVSAGEASVRGANTEGSPARDDWAPLRPEERPAAP
jgi:hypothetical protein